MNIEHKSNMQELKPEDYTKVYAGTGSSLLFEKRIYKINPESPTLPDGPHYKPNLVCYLWQIAYIAGKETVAALAA